MYLIIGNSLAQRQKQQGSLNIKANMARYHSIQRIGRILDNDTEIMSVVTVWVTQKTN